MSFPISISFDVKAPPTAAFDSLAKSAQSLDQAMMSSAGNFDKFGQTVSQLESPLSGVSGSMSTLEGSMSGLEGSLGSAAGSMGEFAGSTEQLNGSISETGGFVTEAGDAMNEAGTSATDASQGVIDLGGALGEVSTTAGDATGGITEFGSGVDGSVGSVDTMNTSLTDMGGIFGTTTEATDTFTGALTGMNAENQAISGGLTENNTLVENLGTTTEATSGKTEGFKSNLALLGTGIAGVVSSGVGLFNSLTSVRDAQIRADAATVRLERSMTTLDGRVIKLTGTTNKMNSDQSLMISGLGEWNSAMSELNGLIDQGITSGNEWDAALQRARAAQAGLTSSTAEGNIVIGEASTQLDKVSQGAQTVAINQGKHQKANEGVGKSWANLIPDIITFTSISGNLSATLMGAKGLVPAFKQLAQGLPAVGGAMGLLGKGAIVAGAALLVLNEATKALDIANQNTVLSFEGTKGAIDGFNEAMRSAIATVPGIGPLIADVNKNLETQINDLTGVTAATDKDTASKGELQTAMEGVLAPLNGLVGGLDASTNASSTAEQGTRLLAGSFQDLGKGTGIVVSGVTHAEGSFTRLADGSVVLGGTLDSTNATMAESGETAKDTGNSLMTYGEALASARQELQEQGVEAENTHQKNLGLLELWGVKYPPALRGNAAAIQGLVTAYQDQGKATEETIASATAYIQTHGGINQATDLSNEGILKLAESLGFETEATEAASAENEAFKDRLNEMADELNKAAEDTRELATAILEEGQAAKDSTEARRQQAMALGVYDEMIKLAIEDQQEFLDQTDEEISMLQDLAKARGLDNAELITSKQALQEYITTHERLPPTQEEVLDKYTELITAKQDEAFETEQARQANILYIETLYGVGVAATATAGEVEALRETLDRIANAQDTARTKIAEWTGEMVAAKAETEAYETQLRSLVDRLLLGNDALDQSVETLEMWIGVIMGAPDALQELNAALDKAWETIGKGVEEVDKLRQGFLDAGEGIKGSIDDTFEDVQSSFDELNETLAEGGEDARNFKDTFKESMEDLADDTDMNIGEIERILGEDLVAALNNPEISDLEFAHMWMQQSGQVQENLKDLTGSYQDFTTDTVSVLREFAPRIGEILAEGVEAGKNPVNELSNLFKQLPTSVQEDLAGVTAAMNLAGEDWSAAVINAMSVMKAGMSDAEWATVFTPMISKFQEMAAAGDTEAQKVVDALGTLAPAGQQASTDTGTALMDLTAKGTAARDQWAADMIIMLEAVRRFGTDSQMTAQNVSGAWSNMAANTNASFQKMAADMLIMLAALVKFQSDAQRTATTVSGAYSNMANNTNSSLSTMTSALTTMTGAFNTFASASQRTATTVSGAFSNMATNTTASMNRMASGIQIILAAFPAMGSRAQSMASQVSSAFSKVASSAAQAESAVKRLQSAINALKSKTITLTTIHRQVIQRVYAASGGAFVATSPTKVGPLNVSEFGQRELVTVTPLENPSGQTITGPGMQVSTSGPGAKAFAKSGDKSISLGGGGNGNGNGGSGGNAREIAKQITDFLEEKISSKGRREGVKMKVEQPQIIILNLEGKQLLKYINKNLFEVSDAIY